MNKFFFLVILGVSCSTNLPTQNFRAVSTLVPTPIPIVNAEAITLKVKNITQHYDSFLENCFTSNMKIGRYIKDGFQVEIFQIDHSNKMISFTATKGLNKHEEIYFIKNGQLIYAKESIILTSQTSRDETVWDCQYYIENDKVFEYVSLGHGKTESDHFNPNEIISLYKKRTL